MDITQKSIVGQVVASDYRTAAVFHRNGIDFCCNGNRSIEDACSANGLNAIDLMTQLQAVDARGGDKGMDFQTWPADLLIDYIEKRHHRYVTEKIPELLAFLEKLVRVHGSRHPELLEIGQEFSAAASELSMHLQKEEHILFPFIRRMAEGTSIEQMPFGSIENPIAMMHHEHDVEGARFRRIAALSNNYTPPEDACNTYRVTYAMLQEFEADLHRHIHLENNILFPKALKMEQLALAR
ncbi:MAG: iron-sulfur cluster repair di-iron protein [Chitinophagales bacterium]|nr:iron-sulfur cluster repair di-iron protein [Chitinophagales bacterium]